MFSASTGCRTSAAPGSGWLRKRRASAAGSRPSRSCPTTRQSTNFTSRLRTNPSSEVYARRGLIWKGKGELDIAIADYTEAIRLDPKFASAYDNRAWLRATAIDVKFRDGRRAVESATCACELTEWKDANKIDTLAAAYAEAGDFDAAVRWEEKAQGSYYDEKDKEEWRARLELYRAKMPYRDDS
jgi:tetratricopeptide (TPR) repeat protein